MTDAERYWKAFTIFRKGRRTPGYDDALTELGALAFTAKGSAKDLARLALARIMRFDPRPPRRRAAHRKQVGA